MAIQALAQETLPSAPHPCLPACLLPAPAGASSWQRLSAAEGELSQHNLAVHRQLEEAAEAWGRQMAELQAACEARIAGGWGFSCFLSCFFFLVFSLLVCEGCVKKFVGVPKSRPGEGSVGKHVTH